MDFTKPSLTLPQLLGLLIERGLVCQDRGHALHYLRHLNYYRLAAYWWPFEVDHATHRVRPGTRFEDVLNLYAFDRDFRLLLMDAIERIEVSIRSSFAHHLARRGGPHAHLDASLFSPRGHEGRLNTLKEKVASSRDPSIRRLVRKYNDLLPPIWACVEVMTLGQLSKWYGSLRHGADRNAIAHCYGMDEVNLRPFLHHLTTVRNRCAHHGRLWNRSIALTFTLPQHRPQCLVDSLNIENDRRIYNTLATIAWLMDCISPGHHWKHRLMALLDKHNIDTRPMGFPDDFRSRPIWAGVWEGTRLRHMWRRWLGRGRF